MPTQSRVKLVLFDLDDTLFDHQGSNHGGLTAIQPHYPSLTQRTIAEIDKDASTLFDSLWHQLIKGEITHDVWLTGSFRLLFTHYGDAPDDALCNAAANAYRDGYLRARQPIAGAVRLLELLRPHTKIGIITNHVTDEQWEKVNHCKLDGLIDFMICADEAGSIKPDSRIFELALEKAECEPHETVMVGDSWSADVIGASRMGMRAVWINRNGRECPDPTLATEITSLEPVEALAQTLLS